jgi:hypothetical protein
VELDVINEKVENVDYENYVFEQFSNFNFFYFTPNISNADYFI